MSAAHVGGVWRIINSMRMTRTVERYFWGVELAVVGLVAILAGWTASSLFANAYLAQGWRDMAQNTGTLAVAEPLGLHASAAEVQRRNLFHSLDHRRGDPGADPHLKGAPRLGDGVIVATQVIAGDSDWSLAAVRFPGASQVRVLGQGSQVGEARITQVTATQLEFVSRGQSGVLQLLPGPVVGPRQTRPKQTGTEAPKCPASIRSQGAGRFSIDRALLLTLIQGLAGTTRDVAVAPLHQGGQLAGLRLVRVRSRSIFHCLGLRSGDQVTAVNNRQLTSPDVLLTLMAQLPGALHIRVSVIRGGRPMTFDYSVE